MVFYRYQITRIMQEIASLKPPTHADTATTTAAATASRRAGWHDATTADAATDAEAAGPGAVSAAA